MKKTKEICGGEERLNPLQVLPMYEDLTQRLKENPKVFTKDQRVKLMCQTLSLTTTKGIVLIGTDGSGKTALVEDLTQYMQKESSQYKDTHVIHIFPQGLESAKTKEDTILFWGKICDEYKSKGFTKLVFFFKVDIQSLNNWADCIENYIDTVKDAFKLDSLKVIIETTRKISKKKENEKEYDPNQLNKTFVLWNAGQKNNTPKKTLKVLKPRIKELSKLYGVKCSKEVLQYFGFAFWDRLPCTENYKLFLTYVEDLFSFAKSKNLAKVDKKLVRNLFKDDFKKMKAAPKDVLKVISYHEAGHALIVLVNEKFDELVFAKVVPSCGSNGMIRTAAKEFYGTSTKKELLSQICVSLAGRISEDLFCNSKLNTGARSDLRKANEKAENMAMNYGLPEILGKNYVILDKKDISQKELRALEQEKRQFLAEAEKMTIKALMKHKKFVELLAKKLQREYIVSGEEIYKMWKKYKKTK